MDHVAATAFIHAHTRLLPVPYVPEIRLYLADVATDLWQKTEDELGAIGLPPPFWAFAWAGGQAVARYVLDHPSIVTDRIVLDVAAGSGLVAIAAAKAGAARVIANDIDRFAGAAMATNAAANGCCLDVILDDIVGRDDGWDVVLAGDVFYQRDMAERIGGWLDGLSRRGAIVLIGDPNRSYLPKERLQALQTYEIPVTRDLEDADTKRSSVWRFRPAPNQS